MHPSIDRLLEKIPGWVSVVVVILLLLIVPAWLLYFTAKYEGVSSILFLVCGIALYKSHLKKLIVENKWFFCGFIVVFAFLGMIFDGAGNFIYNKPFESFCPVGSEVIRNTNFVENYDGDYSILHQFSCFSFAENKITEEIPRWKTLGVRFLEYVLIGAMLGGFYWIFTRFATAEKA